MKRCLVCSYAFEHQNWRCPRCGWQPERHGVWPVFCPQRAQNDSGFKSSFFRTLAALEEGNFWFCARNALITWTIERYCAGVPSFMEIGCGTGFVLQGLARHFPNMRLIGADIYTEGISFAADRIPGCEFMQMDARNIPFVDEFEAIGAFDVLEHIDEDEEVLEQMFRSLKRDGVLLLTVPQHHWLWSGVDDHACHVRRYTACDLHEKLARVGFSIVRSTSFVTILLPLMFLSRLRHRFTGRSYDPQAELSVNPLVDRIFERILHLELGLIRRGVSFPVGGSRLAVAKKIGNTGSDS